MKTLVSILTGLAIALSGATAVQAADAAKPVTVAKKEVKKADVKKHKKHKKSKKSKAVKK